MALNIILYGWNTANGAQEEKTKPNQNQNNNTEQQETQQNKLYNFKN